MCRDEIRRTTEGFHRNQSGQQLRKSLYTSVCTDQGEPKNFLLHFLDMGRRFAKNSGSPLSYTDVYGHFLRYFHVGEQAFNLRSGAVKPNALPEQGSKERTAKIDLFGTNISRA